MDSINYKTLDYSISIDTSEDGEDVAIFFQKRHELWVKVAEFGIIDIWNLIKDKPLIKEKIVKCKETG